MGPLHRARAARWLFYPYLLATSAPPPMGSAQPAHNGPASSAAVAATRGGGGPESQEAGMEPFVLGDALQAACTLCCELALGDNVTAAAAWHLFEAVVPSGRSGPLA